MRIAIQGCLHGELDAVYQILHRLERQENTKIDLVIICGDFQAARNEVDLAAMSIKDKYRDIGSFWKYYSGLAVAPYKTLFIGGNHEASNYMYELYHGGWVAKNIYFMGFANVIRFGPLRIAGLSGIYNAKEYNLGFYEPQPFNNFDKISIYHVRKFNVYRLAQIKTPLDIFLSHDWPRGIAHHGNLRRLLNIKKFLEQEIRKNVLGSFPAEFLLNRLKPAYWFSAHLHVKFAAVVKHRTSSNPTLLNNTTTANPDEIQLTDDIDDDKDGGTTEESTKEAEDVQVVDSHNSPIPSISPSVSNPQAQPSKPSDPTHLLSGTSRPQRSSGRSGHHGKLVGNDFPNKTRFLSLDKVIPGRHFLQVMDIDTEGLEGPLWLSYDQEWLAIVKATNSYFSTKRKQPDLPRDEIIAADIQNARQWVKEHIPDLAVPENFIPTAPFYDPANASRTPDRDYSQAKPYSNPQTVEYCRMLGIDNYINVNGISPLQQVPALASVPASNSILPISNNDVQVPEAEESADAPPTPQTDLETEASAEAPSIPHTDPDPETNYGASQRHIELEPHDEHNVDVINGIDHVHDLTYQPLDKDLEDGEVDGLLADDLDQGDSDFGIGADLDLAFGGDVDMQHFLGDEGDPAFEEQERHSSAE